MTTPNHATQAGIIQYCITPTNYYAIFYAMLLGAWIDLIRLFQKDIDDWYWYNIFHLKLNISQNKYISVAFKVLMLLIPYTNLHIVEDYFCHDKKTGKWKPWVIQVEILFWCLFIIHVLFYLLSER